MSPSPSPKPCHSARVGTRRPAMKKPDYRHCPLLRLRRERPRGRRAAEQRDELAAFHCPMPPVLSTERIPHLGTTGDCRSAAFQSGLCRSWVKPGPLFPRRYVRLRQMRALSARLPPRRLLDARRAAGEPTAGSRLLHRGPPAEWDRLGVRSPGLGRQAAREARSAILTPSTACGRADADR